MSVAWSYYFSHSMISGDQYHLDPIWLDKLLVFSYLALIFESSFYEINYFKSKFWENLVKPDYIIEFLTRLELPLPLPIQLFGKVRASPKSQIFTFSSESTKILEGFISRWSMFDECMNFTAHTQSKNNFYTYSSLRFSKLILDLPVIIFLRSVSMNSNTMNIENSYKLGLLNISSNFVTYMFWSYKVSYLRIFISLIILT